MDSGAALRARAISALRSIRYWAAGAMAGYGSFAGACPDAAPTTVRTKRKRAITPSSFCFTGFSWAFVETTTTRKAYRSQYAGRRERPQQLLAADFADERGFCSFNHPITDRPIPFSTSHAS